MTLNDFNQLLFNFLDDSPTPFHVVRNQVKLLKDNGFKCLAEAEAWSLEAGGKYYVARNGSALIAFVYGKKNVIESGIRLLGAHTDSPCLKVKPNAEIETQTYLKLGVEVYGGALLNPWFDRDLSLAGKVIYQDKQQNLTSCLIDFKKPIASIPSLAIHLDKEANKNRSINPQTDLPPVLMMLDKESADRSSTNIKDKTKRANSRLNKMLFQQLMSQYDDSDMLSDQHAIVDFELSFYDTQKTAYVGINEDFIAGSRLDNLLSCFTGTQALIHADDQICSLLVCSDHEEVGSSSTTGAQGSFLKSVLQRLAGGSAEALSRMIDQSMLISADNAHAVHPNFSARHDANHGPLMNQGPVIKVNANQRYASNCETAAVIKSIAEQSAIPIQNFVVRTDMGCGSTIGPITATEIGVKTLDIGIPTFAMHSIRELCGYKDSWYLFELIKKFFDASQKINIAELLITK